jgi:hypothetical protein
MSIMNTLQPVQMGEDHSDDEDSMSDDSTTDHSMKGRRLDDRSAVVTTSFKRDQGCEFFQDACI